MQSSTQTSTNYISKNDKFIHLFEIVGTFIISTMRSQANPLFLCPVTLNIYIKRQRKKKKM